MLVATGSQKKILGMIQYFISFGRRNQIFRECEGEPAQSVLEPRDRFVEKVWSKEQFFARAGNEQTAKRRNLSDAPQSKTCLQLDFGSWKKWWVEVFVVLCSSRNQLEVASGYVPFHDKLQEHLSAIKIMSWLDGTDHRRLPPRLLLSPRTRLAEILLSSILSPSSIPWQI